MRNGSRLNQALSREFLPMRAAAKAWKTARIAGDAPESLRLPVSSTPAPNGLCFFAGLHRDDIIPGVRIKTDHRRRRSRCGAGRLDRAGRLAVRGGGLLYTCEQRGPTRSSCSLRTDYRRAGAGAPSRPDLVLGVEGGPGPRATPTLSHDHVQDGFTGVLNALLLAANGAVMWSRNAASDTGMKMPCRLRELAIGGRRYRHHRHRRPARRLRRRQRTRRWVGLARGVSYSSPHLCDNRRSRTGSAAERNRRDQRARRRHAALGVSLERGYPIAGGSLP